MHRAAAAALFACLVSACASIGAFNHFTPHDRGATRVVASAAYGDGPRRTLDVYAPDRRSVRAPVVVFFYGGGWSNGAKEDYSFAGDAFAAQGFVTVTPDYRVYPEARFPDFVEDAAAALRWVSDNIARYGGDPERIVLVGHSAGAHIAMLATLDPRYAEAAGFDRGAIRGVVGLAGPYGFENFDMPLLHNVFGAVADPATTMPMNYARRRAPPILLLHGDRDARVPLISSQLMHNAALAAGQSSELRVYAGVDHAEILQALALARRDAAPVFSDTVAFARRVTGQQMAGALQPANAN
jgi:acetyl esterase/lipase